MMKNWHASFMKMRRICDQEDTLQRDQWWVCAWFQVNLPQEVCSALYTLTSVGKFSRLLCIHVPADSLLYLQREFVKLSRAWVCNHFILLFLRPLYLIRVILFEKIKCFLFTGRKGLNDCVKELLSNGALANFYMPSFGTVWRK